MYQTLFLGQINLILLALILTDVWRVADGRNARLGVGVAAAVKLTPAIFIVFFLLAGKVKSAVIAAATFLGCGLIGLIVAPGASERYWEHLFYDTSRVGAPYVSNQSPYAAAIRIAGAPPTSAPGTSSSRSCWPPSGWPRSRSWPGTATGWATAAGKSRAQIREIYVAELRARPDCSVRSGARRHGGRDFPEPGGVLGGLFGACPGRTICGSSGSLS